MVKRTNRIAWGQVAALGGALLLAIPLTARFYYGVAGLTVTPIGADIVFSGEAPGYPELLRRGVLIPPSSRGPIVACGPGGSSTAEICRNGDTVKVICHRIIFFPWRRWRLLRL